MTTKALRKQLVAAIAMVLVAAVALGSSTYAWFAMNTTVTATGMQVSAKSNDTFLLIGTGDSDTAAEIQSDKTTTVALTVADADAKVFPSKPLESTEIGAGKLFATGTAVTDATTAAVPANWYTASSNDPAYSTTNGSFESTVISQTQLSDFTDYVIKKTVYLTLAVGSDTANNLTVSLTSFADGLAVTSGTATTVKDAVKVLVVTSNNMYTFDSSSALNTPVSLHETTNQDITDAAVVPVDIYIYYDGSVDSVYTNNIAHLIGATFGLQFDVSIK